MSVKVYSRNVDIILSIMFLPILLQVILEGEEPYSKEVLLIVKKIQVDESRETFVLERTGGNITLDCLDMKDKATGNIQGLTIWRKNGELIVQNSTQLKLIRVDKDDSGVYHCLVSGHVTKNITLQVNHAPNIQTMQATVKQHPGYPVSMACKVSSLPVPLIRWYHVPKSKDDGDQTSLEAEKAPMEPSLVVASESVSIQLEGFKDGMVTSRLVLDNVTTDMYGHYSCNASNTLGKASSLLKLEYSPVPLVDGLPIDTTAAAKRCTVQYTILVIIAVLYAQ